MVRHAPAVLEQEARGMDLAPRPVGVRMSVGVQRDDESAAVLGILRRELGPDREIHPSAEVIDGPEHPPRRRSCQYRRG